MMVVHDSDFRPQNTDATCLSQSLAKNNNLPKLTLASISAGTTVQICAPMRDSPNGSEEEEANLLQLDESRKTFVLYTPVQQCETSLCAIFSSGYCKSRGRSTGACT
jgi:hypothetical protein